MNRVSDLLQKRNALIGEQRKVLDKAEAESRSLTAEETNNYDKLETDVSALDAQIERETKYADRQRSLAADEARVLESAKTEERSTYEKVFHKWLVNGQADLTTEERSILRSGYSAPSGEMRADTDMLESVNANGGYLVPTTLSNQLVNKLEQVSAVRAAGATVLNTPSGNPFNVPKVTAHAAASGPTAEATAIDAVSDTLAQVQFGAFKYDAMHKVSIELLQDNVIDLEGYLTDELSRKIGRKAGDAYAVGAGTTEPHGLFTAATQGVSTGSAATLAADDIIDLFYSVSPQYRSAAFSANGAPGSVGWIMHDQIAKVIRTLKFSISGDTVSYVWQPSLQAGQPDTILGMPVHIEPASASSVTTGDKIIAFGDISRYYVRMAGGFSLVRLNERFLDQGLVGFLGWIRTDGNLVDANAVSVLTVS